MEPTDPGSPAPPAAPPPFTVVVGLSGFLQSAEAVARDARMELAICSWGLDRRVFGSEGFVAIVRAFALAHRRARVRVLVQHPVMAMQGAHRLVELGRVLSSRIEFREPLPERKLSAEEYLVADERSLVHRAGPDQLEAKFYAHAPLEARLRLRTFNALWDEAVPAREFTDLKL